MLKEIRNFAKIFKIMLEKELEYYSPNKESFKFHPSKEKRPHVVNFKVEPDDTLMTEEEFFAMIDKSIESAKNGNVTTVNNKKELYEFLSKL